MALDACRRTTCTTGSRIASALAHRWQAEVQRHHCVAIGAVAGLGLSKDQQRAEQQSGAAQQQHGCGDFAGDEHAAKPPAARVADRLPTTRLDE